MQQEYEACIQRQFGADARIVPMKHGYDYFSFLVNDSWLVRFPKTGAIENTKKVRAVFLDIFSKKSPLLIPTITFVTDNVTQIEYEISPFLAGVSFEPQVAKQCKPESLQRMGKQLGNFFNELHTFSVEEARNIGIDEIVSPEDLGQYMIDNPTTLPLYQQTVFPHLTNFEQSFILSKFEQYAKDVRVHPYTPRVTHNDMWTYHVIVDPKEETITGIIDFSLRITDPAHDFKSIHAYGPVLVTSAMEEYSYADSYFNQRRLFYTLHDLIFETNRALDEQDTLKFNTYLELLKVFINPTL